MLRVHAKNLGTVAVLCLQGQVVNGETEILRNAVHSLSVTGAVILDSAGNYSRCPRFGSDVGVARADAGERNSLRTHERKQTDE